MARVHTSPGQRPGQTIQRKGGLKARLKGGPIRDTYRLMILPQKLLP